MFAPVLDLTLAIQYNQSMNNNNGFLRPAIGLFAFLLFFFPIYIHAYLEPGTLTYVIQVVVALFVGVMVSLRFFGAKVKDFFKRIWPGKKKDD